MANTNATPISGGAVAGGIFNLSDADLIDLVISGGPMATDASRLLNQGGAVPGDSNETWGLIVG